MSVITDSLLYDLVVITTTIIVGLVAYWKWKLTYWNKIGLQTLSPTIFFGDTKDMLLNRASLGEQFLEVYLKFKSRGLKHGGMFLGTSPFYMPLDPEIIKHIMQKDFQHFVNHANYINEENDPLSGHLFSLQDAKWRNMRVKLTPTFTSGKMKMMFQTLADCTHGLKDIMEESARTRTSVDIKEILGRFTTDIIGSCAFGLECNTLKNPDSTFRKYGKRFFEPTIWENFKNSLQFMLPTTVLDAIKFRVTPLDVEKFFIDVVKETVDYREKNNIYRKDFMHLLLQLKNRGKVTDDHKITNDNGIEEKALNMNELAAQAFVFFLAGFETSSTTTTFALYELVTNPDIQEKLREEINRVLSKHDNNLTYDAIMEMTYMDQVLNETLRLHPPVPVLTRTCTKEYTIPGTSMKLEKGVNVAIPVLGLHTDPDYYPNPDKFDPDRFSDENKNSRPAFTWIPFGEGPRICIGLRFGMLQSKVALVTLLKNYRIKLSNKTQLPIQLEKKGIITTVEGGVWLDVDKLV